MATQGIVSVLEGSNKVVAKLICGCGGQEAQDVADAISEKPGLDAAALYDLADGMGFGCENCLVAMSKDETVFHGDNAVFPLYRETFSLPYFNPRWLRGDGARVALAFWPRD